MASGDTLLVLTPLGSEPTATNFPAIGVRNLHPVLAFDQTTDESCTWHAVMPHHYGGGGVTISIVSVAVPTTGNVIWNTAFERIGAAQQDIDADGFATANASAASAVNGTSGNTIVTTVAHTAGAQMDSVVADELFRLKLTRNAASASDTVAGDVQVVAVYIRET